MKIVADAHIPFVKDYFSAYGELVLTSGRAITHDLVKDADMLLVRSITAVNAELLKDTRVKFVGSVTAGADHLDTKWLDEHNIAWSVATGFNAPPVADYVVSTIAALQRKNLLNDTKVKVGVIGVGHVGKLVADRYKLFNFEVVLCDPLRAEQEKNFHSTPLDELAGLDLISIHVPLTRGAKHPTYHLLDKKFLQRQKPGAVLLNVSRGAVINSEDLLKYGAHLHWCFDVWEHEPNINKTILEKAFIATPHIAGYSVQSKIRGIEMIYKMMVQKKIIQPQAVEPVPMPTQELNFAGEKHRWEDIVLGTFNPLIMTALMHTNLLSAEDGTDQFDEMRNQFNYRFEFAFTKIAGVELADEDRKILQGLGLNIILTR